MATLTRRTVLSMMLSVGVSPWSALAVAAGYELPPSAATRNNGSRMSHQTGRRLAEIGFLLILFAGIWLAAAQIPLFKMRTARTIVAGIALAIGGLLLLIATHSGHFG